jgi:hypothetical protein
MCLEIVASLARRAVVLYNGKSQQTRQMTVFSISDANLVPADRYEAVIDTFANARAKAVLITPLFLGPSHAAHSQP